MDLVEGAAAGELIRFNHFVEVLLQAIAERKEDRSIKEWISFVQSLLDNMICEPETSTEEDYLLLVKHLGSYNILNEYFNEKVSFRVFAHSFLQTLTAGTSTGSFVSSGITFCSLIPMRSIPFKVVAMLGLNFDKFPRKDNSVSFNLMEQKKEKGDRNIKENDKNLFLESLIAAREFLYVSYVGRNTKDNTDFPPSQLIDELVDYIQSGAAGIENVRKSLIKKHPLHGFSRLYNQGDDSFVTYLNMNKPLIEGIIEPGKEIKSEPITEIHLNALVSFFKNPFKGYYNRVLKIYYQEEEVLLSENELFELNGLEKWDLKHELLSMNPENGKRLRDQLVKTGRLPLKNMADVSLENLETEIEVPRQLFQELVGEETPMSKTVELQIDDVLLTGDLHPLYGEKLVVISFSKNECKYQLEAYIKYLAALAVGFKIELYFISAPKSSSHKAAVISQDEAMKRLTELVKLFKKGHEQILSFYPELEMKPGKVADLTVESFIKMVDNKLDNYNFPCTDRYILNEYENGFFGQEGILERFKSEAEHLLEPLSPLFPDYKK